MTEVLHVPVVVVGAGPVGLAVANLLGQDGVDVLLVERNSTTVDHPRAIVLDDEGARTLQAFGAADGFLKRTIEGDGARYFDDNGDCFGVVGAGPRTYGFAKRHFMYQPELEADLVQSLGRFASVDLRFGWNVTGIHQDPAGVTIACTTPEGERTIRCDWLLACDGGRSPIRQWLGIDFVGSTYQQDWIVLDLKADPDQVNYSRFFCSTSRPAVSVPAPRGGRRYEFMLLEGETGAEMLTDDSIGRLIAPYREFRKEDVIRRAIYTFHARIASRMRQGRVLLLGDAAHLTPPFAGQGMNAGVRDAHNVAWKLSMLIKGVADASLLDSYDEERRKPAWAMIQLAVAMGQLVMPKGEEQIALRGMLLKMLDAFPGAQDYFLQMRFKPAPRYDGGLFIDIDRQPYEASLVGQMIPQPLVKLATGKTVRFDEVLGPGFALIAQNASDAMALSQLTHPFWQRLKPSLVHLEGPDKTALSDPTVTTVHAIDNVVRPLRTHRDQIILVRPDRYAAGAFSAADEYAFAERLQDALQNKNAKRMSA
ncbi:MAG: bifunctional 3-(3-hydroxy-phenyl)propionate/3-hydroxycinnamic acid hydroxylase [Pseudolabrys sp.]|jgi:3-(3-hydroxy-phenyl)propionate hydroxylase